MRLLVTGSQFYADAKKVYDLMDIYLKHYHDLEELVIIHGDAPGLDTIIAYWARTRGVKTEPYPADWNTGKGAGKVRNQVMLRRSHPDLCFAFHGGHGTADMVERCKANGVPVKEID